MNVCPISCSARPRSRQADAPANLPPTLKSFYFFMNPSLVQRAHDIEEWVENRFLDHHGIVYTYIDTENEKPLTDSFFGPNDAPICHPGVTPATWHRYENCSMATAAYMMGLLYRHAVEGDPIALDRARKAYHALTHIYEVGKTLEEGFLPKIYHDKFSEQTSTDQVLYVMYAFDLFHQFATASEKAEIDRMMVHIVHFWVKRNYCYTYFWMKDMPWPMNRFPTLLLMAYNHSGDPIFKKEYDRILATGVTHEAVEARYLQKLKPDYVPTPFEKKMNAYIINELEGSVSMGTMEMCYLLKHDPENSWVPNWKLSIQQQFDEAKLVLAPDGTMYVHVLVDFDTGVSRQMEPGFFDESKETGDGMGDWVGWRYAAGCRSGDSVFIARALVQAHIHMHDEEMDAVARHILQSIDLKGLRAYYDPERFLPELRHRTRLYSGDGAANWLWGYWQGRADNVVGE